MATAIKKLSGFTPSWLATLRAIGHMTAAVAALFMKSDSVMVTTSIRVRAMIGLPWAIKRYRTSLSELGVHRWPNWKDGIWLPLGAVGYVILSALLTSVALVVLPFFDSQQPQDTGFSGISGQFEYILAFVVLVIVAPVAEEVLFRGYLFGKLRKYAPVWVAVLVTSVVFAVVHFQWNVGVDVFALSIVLCVLRIITGSLWPAIFLHMAKNGLAFYLLFINPLALGILG